MKNKDEKQKQKESAKKTGIIHKLLVVVALILCVVFGFLLFCNLTLIIKGSIYPDRPPSVLGKTPLAVLSGSMSGTAPDHIEPGDLIFVDKIEPTELEIGNVIAFMSGKTIVTHRIIGIETIENGELQFMTQGDANNAADPYPVAESELVGILIYRIPNLGKFVLFMQTPLGMVLFIGIPVFVLVVWDVIRRRIDARKEKKKTAELEAEIERLRALAGETETPVG